MLFQVASHGKGVLRMPLQPEVQCLNPLQQQEGAMGRKSRSHIAQTLDARLENERQRAKSSRVGQTVIRRVWLREFLESARSGPIELTRVNNDSADGGAMASQEFCGGVDYDVRTPLNRSHKSGRRRGVVDHQGQSVLMSNGCQFFNIHDVELGIAERLGVYRPRLLIDRGAQTVEVVGIDKPHRNAQSWQGVVEEVICSAVQRRRRNNLIARSRQRGDNQRLGGLARGRRETRYPALERGNPLLEDIGGWVHDACVDVAKFLEGKQAPRVVSILKEIGSGLVNGNCARACCRVGRLAGVDGQGVKMLLGFGHRDLLRFRQGLGCGRDGSLNRAAPKPENQKPESFSDPGRLVSRSVATSAFATQNPHGRVRTPYKGTWP